MYMHDITTGTLADTGEPVQFCGYNGFSKKTHIVYRRHDHRIFYTPDVVFPESALRVVSHFRSPNTEVEPGRTYQDSDVLMDKSEAAIFEKDSRCTTQGRI
jgi:hypothetical protein